MCSASYTVQNSSYAGPSNTGFESVPYPAPKVYMNSPYTHRTVLPAIVDTWGKNNGPSIYNDGVVIPDGQQPPKGFAFNTVSNS